MIRIRFTVIETITMAQNGLDHYLGITPTKGVVLTEYDALSILDRLPLVMATRAENSIRRKVASALEAERRKRKA